MAETLISVQSLTKIFRGTPLRTLFSSLNLEVKPQETLTFLGPSGCGKSTLLRILSGLDKDFSGKVVSKHKSTPAIVFQESRLLPWLTLRENILLPLSIIHQTSDKLENWIQRLGLKAADLSLFPQQLSGGMKMRASLARALITEPELIFMDEPFSALDEPTRFSLQDLMQELGLQKSRSLVFVTHSITEAVSISDRIVLFNRQGQIHTEFISPLPRHELRSRSSIDFQNLVQDINFRFRELQ